MRFAVKAVVITNGLLGGLQVRTKTPGRELYAQTHPVTCGLRSLHFSAGAGETYVFGISADSSGGVRNV